MCCGHDVSVLVDIPEHLLQAPSGIQECQTILPQLTRRRELPDGQHTSKLKTQQGPTIEGMQRGSQAAIDEADDGLDDFVVLKLVGLVDKVVEDDADHLHDRDDK